MNALSPDHPAQLAWGFVIETEAQARAALRGGRNMVKRGVVRGGAA
jgi:hypothetical protein